MIKKIKNSIKTYANKKRKENEKLFLFRIFSLLFVLNFFLFLFLTNTELSSMLNPLSFLTETEWDRRSKAVFYFPLSVQLDSQKKQIKSFPGKILRAENSKMSKKTQEDLVIQENAITLIDTLISGIQNPRAAKIPIHKNDIRKLWFYQNSLVIDVKKTIWENFTKEDSAVYQSCIEKTLQENIPQIQKVVWSYSKDRNLSLADSEN